MKPEIQHIIQ